MKKRILAFAMAFAMVLSMITPNLVMAQGEETNKTKIVIHKIKLKGPNIEGKDAPNENYDGSKINDLGTYFGSDQNPEELNGVTFTYWKVTKEQYKEMKENSGNYETKESVNDYLDDVRNTGTTTDPTAGSAGVEVAGLVDGYYWFIENVNSKVEGGAIAETAAVPFGLILPTYNKENVKFDNSDNPLHVYPKNTVKKPKVDKNFGDKKVDLEDSKRVKDKKTATIGETVPYFVKTEIPVGSRYKTANWSDQMTEGLTFNEDSLIVTVKNDDNTDGVNLTKDNDYTLSIVGNGFDLKFKDAGLAKINKQTKLAYVEIKYSATLNSKAIVAIPESNDVTFHYGNNPDNGNTPIPTKPSDGNITVKKTWAEEDGLPEEGIDVTFTLYNAQTGKKVVVGEEQENPKTFSKVKDTVDIDYEWTGLDNDTEYKVVETYNGYSAEYQKSETAGEIKVVNHKDDNPGPLNPSSPQVVTYGKRFVKTDSKDGESMERLAKAEFIVTREAPKTEEEGKETQYLVKKSKQGSDEDLKKYLNAKHAYENYIADHNTDNVDQTEVKKLMKVRDDAFANASTQYEWKTAKDKAAALELDGIVKLVSGDGGRFEITGLEAGSYKLLETKKPSEEFADNNDPIDFEVNENSYKAEGDISYETKEGDQTGTNAQRVINKKVTIPQTGGIGTIIFTVAGLALMATAIISMKKRKAEDN